MKKILIAIDSFKGCLSSIEAAKAAEKAVLEHCPKCECLLLPIADGGEGMQELLIDHYGAERIELEARDPLLRSHICYYGIDRKANRAIIEMASISGLALLKESERNPWLTTSYGTGELIRDALERGCRDFLIGIGGSATNDAGLGMLQALGFRFLDADGMELGRERALTGADLASVQCVDTSSVLSSLAESRFRVACDVDNPLFGREGAAYVYAPQKGADSAMVAALDEGLRSFARVIEVHIGRDISALAGTGAAGGMGAALLAFLGAELESGIELILEAINFEEQMRGADLTITGEGKADLQSMRGKVPWGILQSAKKQGIDVVLIAGAVEHVSDLNAAGFLAVLSICPAPQSLAQAMDKQQAERNIQDCVAQICRLAMSR